MNYKSDVDEVTGVIIEGKIQSVLDTDLKTTNFYGGGAPPRLIGPPRFTGNVTEIIVHETAGPARDVATTIRSLKRRKLGVHFVIGPEGEITQHADLVHDAVSHAGPHNKRAVGIEVFNPYYPKHLKSGPWEKVIDARWAHGRKYVVPVVEQLEALYQLLTFLTQTKTERFDVPWSIIGLDVAKKRLSMSRVPWTKWGKKPGIYAHAAFAHADGAFPLLYCLIREARPLLGDRGAWTLAVELAERAKWSVDLGGVL
jgi:hypothetical protein